MRKLIAMLTVVTLALTATAEITTLGNYPYVKVSAFTNASSSYVTSNYVAFHWK